MQKVFLLLSLLLVFMCGSGCGTIFGGKISQCQQTKPVPPQPKREIRVAALIGDLVVGALPLAIDFATGGIYKPCEQGQLKK